MDNLHILLTGHDRIDKEILPMTSRPLALHDGSVMVAFFIDGVAHLLRTARHNQQRLLLVTLMKCIQHLGGGILENNGIERLVPSENQACGEQYHDVDAQGEVPRVLIFLLRHIDGDKIGTTRSASTERQMQMAKPLKIPPNIHISKISFVNG